MERNAIDIRLLRDDPHQLILHYQPIIRIIAARSIEQSSWSRNELPDLVQEVNRKLLERIDRIRQLYNGKSLFRTYFSVVVRNMCLEETRKSRMVAEPPPGKYRGLTHESTLNDLTIRQEMERLKRALRLFHKEELTLWLALRCQFDLTVQSHHLASHSVAIPADQEDQILELLNSAAGLQKKDKLEILGRVFCMLGEKDRNPEALRKWFKSRLEEVLALMNGRPPRSAYTEETLQILMEKEDE